MIPENPLIKLGRSY